MSHTWSNEGTIASFRLSGKVLYCYDPANGIAAGYYFFHEPKDDQPIGPFTTSRIADSLRRDLGMTP